jgi:hypothetical protein
MKRILLIYLLFPVYAFAQSVGIGTNVPDASAMLDVTSNTKGLLIPRMTEAQKLAIVLPATGLLIWQTDATPGFYYNSGTPGGPKWYMLGITDTDWKLNGNAGTDPANQKTTSTGLMPVPAKRPTTLIGPTAPARHGTSCRTCWTSTDSALRSCPAPNSS